jgi:DNA phosphorothioation-associated putative methyltransferase
MTFSALKEHLKSLPCGKRLNHSVYITENSLAEADEAAYKFVEDLKSRIEAGPEYNIIKFFTNEFKISYLSYPDFFDVPHPALKKSITLNVATGKTRKFNYEKSLNPPILHRKETFLYPGHHQIETFSDLTRKEETCNLYENTSTIGFKLNWEKLLNEKGLSYQGHELIKSSIMVTTPIQKEPVIDRHKTAISRYNFSKPVQSILEYNLLEDNESLFDYGCGLGDDLRGLTSMGYKCSGWDPVHKADEKKNTADVVNLGFVLNVIENPEERIEVLHDAYGLSKKLLVVTTLLTNDNTASNPTPHKDGYLTNRNTFQKYYEQPELQQFIEDTLDTSAITAGPGVFYVFKDPVSGQDFLANRSRRKIDWETISSKLYPDRAERKRIVEDQLIEQNEVLVKSFWDTMLELGRIPLEEEFPDLKKLFEKVTSAKRLRSIFIEKYGADTIQEAYDMRMNDLLVYLALSNFKRKVPFKHLPMSLKADIKTFFGSYKQGVEESMAILFKIGNPETIITLCEKTHFGYHDKQALFIHKSLRNDLDPVLRIYIGCAGLFYGALDSVDIIKIHKASGKVTLLIYDDFEGKELPELHQRIKVNLKNQRIDFFNHKSVTNPQVIRDKGKYYG